MADNDINILLRAKLNADKSDIEEQIRKLSNSIKERLELKLKINAEDLEVITKKIDEVHKRIKQKEKQPLKFGSLEETSSDMKRVISDLERIQQHFNTLGKNVQVKQLFDGANESLKKFEVSMDTLNGKLKETQKFSVNVQTDKEGNTSYGYSKIAMDSKTITEAKVKEATATKQATKELSAYAQNLNNLIHAYKMKEVSDDKFLSTMEKLRSNTEFTTLSQKKQEQVVNLLTQAEKNYQKVVDQGINIKKKQSDNTEKQLQYEQKARLAVEQLQQKELERLSNIQKETIGTFSNLKGDQVEAAEIAKTLSKQYGDLEVRGQSLNKTTGAYSVTLRKNAKENLTLKGVIDKTTGSLRVQNETVAMAKNVQLGFGQQLKIAVERLATWGLATTALYGSMRLFKEGLQNLKEIDTELVNIAKVTNYTNAEMKELAKTSAEVGVQFGRTAQEYLQSVTEFARAGMGKQAEELGKTSLLLQNVGDVSAETANEMLLAVNAAYKLGGSQEKLTEIINSLNNVSNKNPTSVAKMADGIKVAASVFEQAGFNINEFIALVGTATSSTQRSGAEMARGLRTVLMNIRGVQDEEAETTLETISDADAVLRSIGVEVRDSTKNFREPMQVLSELAKKYEELGKAGRTVKQAEILETLAGKRQSNILSSVLTNWDMVNKQIDEATNSSGSALKENEIYMNSWEAKSKQLSASMTVFWQNLINTDAVKGFIDALRGLVVILDKVVNNGFTQVLITTGLVTGAFTLLTVGINSFQASTLAVRLGLIGIDIAEKGLLATTKALKTAMLSSPLFWVAAGTAAIYGLVKLIDHLNVTVSEQKQKVEDLTNEYNSLQSKIQVLDGDLKTTVDRIDELNSKDKLSIIEKDELEKLKLSNKELKSRIDLLNEQEKNTSNKLGNEALNLYKKMTPEISRVSIDNVDKDSSDSKTMWNVINNSGYKKDTQNINILMAAYEKLIELQKESSNPKDIKKYEEQLVGVKDKIVAQNLALMDVRDKLRKLPDPTKEQQDAIEEINKSLVVTQSLIDPEKLFNNTWASLNEEQQKYIQTLNTNNQLTPIQIQQYSDLFNLLKYGGFTFSDLKDAIGTLNTTQEENAQTTQFVIDKTEELDKLYKSSTDSLKFLNQTLSDVAEGESLSADQLEDLMLKYPELRNHIIKTAEGYTIEKEAIEILNKVREQEQNTALLAQAGITQIMYDGLKQRLEAYGIEIEAINSLSSAYKTMMPYMSSGSSNSKIIEDTLAYGNAIEKIQALKTALTDPTYGVKSSTKKEKKETDLNEIEIDAFYRLQDVIDKTNNLMENHKKLLSNTSDAEKQIAVQKQLIELYKQQQTQLHNITEAKRDAVDDNSKKLKGYGFEIVYDRESNDFRILNEENLLKIRGKTNEETNKIVKTIQDIIKQSKSWNTENQQAGKEWQNLNAEIIGGYDNITDIYEKQKEANKKALEDAQKLKEENEKLFQDSNKQIIDLLKKRYEQEEKIKKKAHDEEIDRLDEDLDNYKEYISERIDELDKLYNKEDYEKDVTNQSDEILKIQKDMDKYSLAAADGDREAIAKIKELNEKKAELEEKLLETQTKRERDLRKENLDDNLKNFERYTEEKKDAENKSFEEYKAKLEQTTSDTALAMEAQKLLMTGTVESVQSSLIQLFSSVGENATIAGKLVQSELLDKIAKLQNIGTDIKVGTQLPANSIKGASSLSMLGIPDFAANQIKNLSSSLLNNISLSTPQMVSSAMNKAITIGDINLNIAGSVTDKNINKINNNVVTAIKDTFFKSGIK